jgi:predicted CoA-binding protein
MEEKELIDQILKDYKNIAVVGISDKSDRDSFKVAKYLQKNGYNVIPINPLLTKWEGQECYPTLEYAAKKKNNIEIVDIFRKPEAVKPIVDDAVVVKAKVVWMQLGVENEEAAKEAEKNSIKVIMNKCIMEEHKKR